MIGGVQILVGDVRAKLGELPDESIHCVVTSPPYWGLRDYGVEGQLGLEPTPELYVEHMVEVFREVRRVLRKDGTLWLNLGDCYYAGGWECSRRNLVGQGSMEPSERRSGKHAPGLKVKDLVGMPWRVAFALQADGWWLRSDIIWYKPNPMPESIRDRPTKAHEYIFLLAKSKKYFFDMEAAKEPSQGQKGKAANFKRVKEGVIPPGQTKPSRRKDRKPTGDTGTRQPRDVWTIVARPVSGAHFATFPEKFVEPCIKAGTSEKGCCSACGAPWTRVVKKQCWKPSCKCKIGDPQPCVVLDPFLGSGTTAVVALGLNRAAIGIELNPEYAEMAWKRVQGAKAT